MPLNFGGSYDFYGYYYTWWISWGDGTYGRYRSRIVRTTASSPGRTTRSRIRTSGTTPRSSRRTATRSTCYRCTYTDTPNRKLRSDCGGTPPGSSRWWSPAPRRPRPIPPPNTDEHADANANPDEDANADAHQYANGDRDANLHADEHRDGHATAYGDLDPDVDGPRHPDVDPRASHQYAVRPWPGRRIPDGDELRQPPRRHRFGHADAHGDAHCDHHHLANTDSGWRGARRGRRAPAMTARRRRRLPARGGRSGRLRAGDVAMVPGGRRGDRQPFGAGDGCGDDGRDAADHPVRSVLFNQTLQEHRDDVIDPGGSGSAAPWNSS